MTSQKHLVVAGSTGLIGNALLSWALARGTFESVTTIDRVARACQSKIHRAISWTEAQDDFEAGHLPSAPVTVVNLSGSPIGVRWSTAVQSSIVQSRVFSTALLSEQLAGLARGGGGRVRLINASAVGVYGTQATLDERVDDESSPVPPEDPVDFGQYCCAEWEAATLVAEEAGVEVCHARIGVVLSSQGGALAKMLLPFRLGLGGPLGTGKQPITWVSITDAVGMLGVLIDSPYRGKVNIVTGASEQEEFARTLARALGRPCLIPTPAFMIRLLYGQMADELLLRGHNVQPKVMRDQLGYKWQHPTLKEAIESALKS
jgi:uncharacterized protein (TIGR01777 family)